MTDPSTPEPSRPATAGRDGAVDEAVDRAGGFALSEDWLATLVGLAIVVLALLGVITEGWLPL